MYNYKELIKNINSNYRLEKNEDDISFINIINLLEKLFENTYYYDKLNNRAVFIGKYNIVITYRNNIIKISVIDMNGLIIKNSLTIKNYHIYTNRFLFWSKKEFYTEERLLKIIHEYMLN